MRLRINCVPHPIHGAGALRTPGGRLRVAYLAHGLGGLHDGVRAKILSQTAAWSTLDPSIDVGLFVQSWPDAVDAWRASSGAVSVRPSHRHPVARLANLIRLYRDLLAWRPDVVYWRQWTVSPTVVLAAIQFPLIVEVNTNDVAEIRVTASGWRRSYWPRSRAFMLRRARGAVFVTEELSHLRSFSMAPARRAVIPNAVDLDRYCALPAPRNAQPRLVFVGSSVRSAWHGLDRIERLAGLFPEWRFDIVGPRARDLPGAPDNLRVHGPLPPRRYRTLLANADVALGPLALHRIGISEAAPLKVGEYLAHGLPVITGHRDPRFPTRAPFLLELQNADGDMARECDGIREFVGSWMGRRIDRADISAIDVRVIERRRVEFIRTIAAGEPNQTPAPRRHPRDPV